MSTLTDLRSRIQTALAAVPGLQAYSYVPGQVNVPCAIVIPDNVSYDADFEHGCTYTLPIQFLVALGDWESAQLVLDDLVAHDGTAVNAVNTAAGVEAQVLSMSQYGIVTYGTTDYLGARLTVEVFVG